MTVSGHGTDVTLPGQDDADLHGGQLGHGADGDGLSYSERRHSEGYPGARRCGGGLRFRHRGAGGRLGGGYGFCRSAADPSGRGELIEPQTLTVPEGGANSYTLVLGSRPTGDVTVGVTLPAGTDLTLDKTTLTFTVDNWDVAQTVTVTAAEDDDGVTDAGVTLTHTVSGGGYGSTTVPDVEVSITENDTAGLVLSETGLTVTEGDAAGSSYTVKLATEPTGSVSVTITGHAGTDLTLDKTTLTFTVGNWDTAQTVTVKAGGGRRRRQRQVTLTHTASGGDYGSVSNGGRLGPAGDGHRRRQAGVTIEPTALSVVAGRSNEYTVVLATEPTGDVTVTVTGHAGTAVTLDKTTLTFTVDNWDDAQTVTVSAAQNAATAKVTLAHAVAGADYGSVTAEPVVVSVVGVAGQQPTLQVGVSSSDADPDGT